MNSSKKLPLLIAACVILIAALVWLYALEAKSPVRALCTRLEKYGLHVAPGDMFLQGYGSDVSIRGLLLEGGVTDEEAERAADLSRGSGFGGDIDSTGKVQLLMWQKSDSEVLLVYMLDDSPELVFFEETGTGLISSAGTPKA